MLIGPAPCPADPGGCRMLVPGRIIPVPGRMPVIGPPPGPIMPPAPGPMPGPPRDEGRSWPPRETGRSIACACAEALLRGESEGPL